MGLPIVIGLALLIGTLTAMNVRFAYNIRQYVNLLRRGMVRVRIRYEQDNTVKTMKGWVYLVDLNSVLNKPVSYSSAFVKVYVRGHEETAVAFSTVKKVEVLKDSYLSVIFSSRAYL